MSARDTYNASVASAASVQAASVAAAQTAAETTIDGSLSAVGYNLNSGATAYATLAAAIKASIIAKRNALQAAEMAKQASIAAAKDTLRTTGDTGPF